MKIESKAAEGKINPNVVTVIVAALLLAALAGGIYYFNSPEARANGLIEKAGTGIDEADYDNAITDLKGAYELDPENAEANAIISASRRDMIGATIYLVGRDARTDELLPDAMSCSMCKRQIINAGIDKIVIRTSPTEYRTIPVSDWIENDDSIFML